MPRTPLPSCDFVPFKVPGKSGRCQAATLCLGSTRGSWPIVLLLASRREDIQHSRMDLGCHLVSGWG